MGLRVAVAGASGYAGGELLRLVLGHPDLELGAVCAGNAAGRPVLELHPGLLALADLTFAPTDPDLLSAADLVFLALPHGESAGVVAQLPPGLPVVDLGADFRLRDAQALGAPTTAPSTRTPARGPTACPSCPARAPRSRDVPPRRQPRLLRDRGGPGARAAARRRPGGARRRGRRGRVRDDRRRPQG